ncbi:hypothetical protein E4U30_001165 [Claviceps sp. LM220 group G6]|nr:hypothetical protein E4U30_001165 [Claviceps sp. LM220 group G6]
MVNTVECHRNIDGLLRKELKGRMHDGIPDFLETFFPSMKYQEVAEQFLNRCKTGTGVESKFNDNIHRFETWPDLTTQEQVIPWMQTFSKELEEFSRIHFSTNDDGTHSRAFLGQPNKFIKGHMAKRKLDACFISAADLEFQSGGEALNYFWTMILSSAEHKENNSAERAAELALAQYTDITHHTRHKALCPSIHSLRVLFEGAAIRQARWYGIQAEDLGFDPSIKGPDVKSYGPDVDDELKPCIEITKEDGSKEVIVLDEQIFKSSCVVGRGDSGNNLAPAGEVMSKVTRRRYAS